MLSILGILMRKFLSPGLMLFFSGALCFIVGPWLAAICCRRERGRFSFSVRIFNTLPREDFFDVPLVSYSLYHFKYAFSSLLKEYQVFIPCSRFI